MYGNILHSDYNSMMSHFNKQETELHLYTQFNLCIHSNDVSVMFITHVDIYIYYDINKV